MALEYYNKLRRFKRQRRYYTYGMRPLEGSNPFDGEVGTKCEGVECKIEIRCRWEYVKSTIKVIKEIHPYEEPLINIIPINELFE